MRRIRLSVIRLVGAGICGVLATVTAVAAFT